MINVTMVLKGETPNKFRYTQENPAPAIVGDLYVWKGAYPNGAPKSIALTVRGIEQ